MRTSSSACAQSEERAKRRRGRTYDPAEGELEASHVRAEDVLEHRLVVAENAFEEESVVRRALWKGLAETVESEEGRGAFALGGEGVSEVGSGDSRIRLTMDDNAARDRSVESRTR